MLSPDPPEWRISAAPVAYEHAVDEMEARVEAVWRGAARELIWLLEHPSCYTAGVSAQEGELLEKGRFPIYRTGRGGQFTYHGPGQRVVYVICDLRRRHQDVRGFVRTLEEWLIKTLEDFHVKGERRAERPGIWVVHQGQEAKIAALGLRIRRWISYHGLSVNVAPELEHFSGIVPCGIREHKITSLAQIGKKVSMSQLDAALQRHATVLTSAPQTSPIKSHV